MYVIDIEIDNPLEGVLDEQKVDAVYRSFMENIADRAYDLFVTHIPFSSGKTLANLEKGDVNKHAGGLWTVSVGVTALESDPNPLRPLFTHEGTGLFRRDGRGGLITPQHGNVMVFEKRGEGPIFTRHVVGQIPQPYLDKVEEELEPYVRVQKRRIAAIMDLILKTS